MFLTQFFFSKKKKINIILFLFRLVGNLLHHCCCYIPTVHLLPFNFHRFATARPARLKIANMFPPRQSQLHSTAFFPLRMPISVKKRKKKRRKNEAAEVCCTPETDYYHVYRWRLSSRSLNNLLVKSRKKGCTVNTTSLKQRFHFPDKAHIHTVSYFIYRHNLPFYFQFKSHILKNVKVIFYFYCFLPNCMCVHV